jgi:hypothetical protein
MVFQEDVRVVTAHTQRLQRLEQELQAHVASWRLHPVVGALQALPGVSLTVAVTTGADLSTLSLSGCRWSAAEWAGQVQAVVRRLYPQEMPETVWLRLQSRLSQIVSHRLLADVSTVRTGAQWVTCAVAAPSALEVPIRGPWRPTQLIGPRKRIVSAEPITERLVFAGPITERLVFESFSMVEFCNGVRVAEPDGGRRVNGGPVLTFQTFKGHRE